jgi:hypothetical protein
VLQQGFFILMGNWVHVLGRTRNWQHGQESLRRELDDALLIFLAKGVVRKTGRRTQIQNRQVLEEIASEFKADKAPHLVSFLVSAKEE